MQRAMRIGPRGGPLLILAGVLFLPAPSADAQAANYTISSVTATIGSSVNVPILVTTTADADAFSIGVQHLSPDLTVTGVALGSAIVALAAIEASVPEFFEFNLAPALPAGPPTIAGGFTVGLILDFSVLPVATRLLAGIAQEMLVATYAVDAGAAPQLAALELTGALGSPAIDVVVVLSVAGTPIEVFPTLTNGIITIVSVSFRRGDADGNGTVSLLDGVLILYRSSGLLANGPCTDAEDVNDNGLRDIVDAAYLFQYMFAGGPLPPEPFVACGDDLTLDAFGCGASTCP